MIKLKSSIQAYSKKSKSKISNTDFLNYYPIDRLNTNTIKETREKNVFYEFRNRIVRKISCGLSHTIALISNESYKENEFK